jgi:hypothetical protein
MNFDQIDKAVTERLKLEALKRMVDTKLCDGEPLPEDVVEDLKKYLEEQAEQ